MARIRIDRREAFNNLFWTAPHDVEIVMAEVVGDDLVLYLSGPSIPNVDEVEAAQVEREEKMTTLSVRTAFVPKA